MSVLNALPQDVRHEIIKEYKLENVTSTKKKVEVETVEKQPEKKSIFNSLSYEQLKQAIRVWLCSESTPGDFDIQMLGEFFRELAMDRRIGVLRDTLNFLHRYCYFRFLNEYIASSFCFQKHREAEMRSMAQSLLFDGKYGSRRNGNSIWEHTVGTSQFSLLLKFLTSFNVIFYV